MKICYSGPKNLHTERWVTFFAHRGHEVHLIVDEPVAYEGVIVHSLDLKQEKSIGYFVRKLKGLKRALREIRPDLLHTHYITGEGYVSALAGFHPYVVSIWGNDIYLRPHTRFEEKWFTRFVLKRADLITADSHDQIDAAVRLGADRRKGRVIQWGVDLDTFRPTDGEEVRARLGIGTAPLVLSQRKFLPMYHIDVILHAFTDILRTLPDANMIITGSGVYEEDIRSLVARLELEPRVHFTGYVPYDQLPAYISAADVSVSVPSSDGTAMTLLEAMACGTPLIVSDLPSNREWIQDGVNGFVVPVGDRAKLADRLLTLLADPPLRERFRAYNLSLVRRRANRNVHMELMEAIYAALIEGQPIPDHPVEPDALASG
ncbi:MAG: glycosyltransferase [candidate division Zixibacteria bacterium]|nr:glycosyltransferase [candidate division Zixibacteria bacterium]